MARMVGFDFVQTATSTPKRNVPVYHSTSKGVIEIPSMNKNHLLNALKKQIIKAFVERIYGQNTAEDLNDTLYYTSIDTLAEKVPVVRDLYDELVSR